VVGLLSVAHEDGWSVTAPSTAIAEWWRGRTDVRESILAAIDVESVSLALARLAGEAMARVRGATLADAAPLTRNCGCLFSTRRIEKDQHIRVFTSTIMRQMRELRDPRSMSLRSLNWRKRARDRSP
jgi:hypothetical protein